MTYDNWKTQSPYTEEPELKTVHHCTNCESDYINSVEVFELPVGS